MSENVIKADVLNLSVRIVFCGIVIQFLKIVTSIFYAMQKTALPNLLALLSSIAVLAFVNIYSSKDVETKLIALSFAQVITMCLPLLFANIVVFMTGLKDSKPNIHFFDLNTGKAVVGLGGKFFVIQVSLLVITSTNEMLISNLSGSAHVVEYQTYNRIFSMVIVLFSLLIQPMWSAFSQANATKNYKWMRNVYTKFKIFAALGSVGCFFIAFIFDTIVKIWLGTDVVEIYLVYALCFAVLTSITLFVNSATSIANGMNELRCQMLWTVIGAIAKIPLSFILVYLFNAWIGVIISNIIVLIPLVVFQSWSSNKKLIQRERELVYETTKTYLI